MHQNTKRAQNIAFTGWATGGHVFPILSVYNYLQEQQSEDKKDTQFNFYWFWEEESLEEEISIKNKIPFYYIPSWKIRRYFDVRNFYEPLKNLTGVFFGIYYLIILKIDIIFSKWGYVSLPLCIAGFLLRKKIYIHESDSTEWLANKIISKLATKVFYTFPNPKINEKKYVLSGQILNPELLDGVENITIEENEQLNVMVIAGSQWSTTLFTSLLQIIPKLPNIQFHITLGEKNTQLRSQFKQFPNTLVHDFIPQKRLWKILKNIDIAITRGGATTLWELHAFGIHSIIVPLPHSAGNHQFTNAQYFHSHFWSDIINESQVSHEELFKKLKSYEELRKQGLNLEWFFKPLQKITKHF